ncbi:putative Adenine phosphoribosyltransferase-like protein [Thalictrum thalictroides]|uniref:Putative Adenine phosphoribosyltransferase-like protein n=1 Tax=Thalictrum thalictroides TaxID=46969 RepID=A0A7J6WI61_THATH|nr:putative Adenine phosphoribosyltransferase-like protein [Thalictrum thalictroides]
MATVCFVGHTPITNLRLRRLSCSSSANDNKKRETQTPQLLKIAVSGITELLRIFSSSSKDQRLDTGIYTQKDQPLVCGIDDIIVILQSDYENAYFLTGNFTSSIYAEDCSFEDPTITFRGKDLYARNLKLLVPFFDCPSLSLQQIEKVVSTDKSFVLATWKLRTYLKLPWRPLISIEGNTVYDLDDDFKIARHAESWNVSALEAVGQIFTPST